MLTRIVSALVLLLISYSASASAEVEWVLRDSKSLITETLRVLVSVDSDCPVSTVQVEQIVDSELLRAHITRVESTTVALYVDLSCLPVEVGDRTLAYAMHTNIKYCRQTNIPDSAFKLIGCGDNHGGLRLVPESINGKETVEVDVRRAIDDFLFTAMKYNH